MADKSNSVIVNAELNADGVKVGVADANKYAKEMAITWKKAGERVKSAIKAPDAAEEYKAITAQINKAEKDLNRAIEAKDRFLATGGSEGSKQYQKYQYDIENITRVLEEAKAERGELDKVGASAQDAARGTDAATKSNNGFFASISKVASALRSFAANGLRAAISGIKTLISHLGSLAAKGLKKAANGIKSLASHFGKLAKNALSVINPLKKIHKSTGGGLKNILKYAIGIRSLFVLFNRMRSAIKEGFGNLAQYSGDVNKSISAVTSSLTYLKNALATAFAPIVNVITPILSQFIDLLAEASTKVGMLFASLTGQKTFTKAVKVQEDYAESLGDTADEAKEAQKYLSGLDEIRTFTEDKSGGTSAGGGKASPQDMFEDVEVPSAFENLAQRIKDAFAQADFTTFGAEVAAKISTALEKIPWEKIRARLNQVAQSLATFLNGLISNPELWANLGKALGEGINSVIGALYTFLTEVNWRGLGEQIANLLNNLVATINWDLLGQTVAAYINAWANLIYGAVTTFDWAGAASAFATGVNSLVTSVDWELLGATIAETFNGIVTFLNGVFVNIDWGKIGQSLANGLNSLISNIDWAGLGSLFANGLNALTDIVYEAVTTFDWEGLGASLAESVNTFADDFDWRKAGESLGEGIKSILKSINTFIEETDWQQIGRDVATFIAAIDWTGVVEALFEGIGAALGGLAAFVWGLIEDAWNSVVDWWYDVAYDDGGFTMQGLLDGIWEGIKNIGAWIKEHIFDPFINGFKKAFGIASPSTVMSEQGGFIIDGLLGGLKRTFAKITTWLGTILAPFKNAFNGIITFIKGVFSGDWKKAWEGIKQTFGGIWDGMKALVKTPINAIIGFINGLVSGVVDGLNAVIKAMNKLSFDVPDWVPGIGGKTFGFNIKPLTAPRIPLLAQGAVIPPNAPFAAVLGDQRRGTNIEAPLDTIKEAVRAVMKENGISSGAANYTFIAQINRRTLFEEMMSEAQMRRTQSGRNPFELA